MSKEVKGLVPELRFAEFKGDWERTSIEKISTIITSGSRGWAQYYSAKGAKFIRMTNLDRNNIDLLLDDLKYVSLPSNNSEGKRTALTSGDILISITAELGKIGIVPNNLGKAYVNQHVALVRPNSDKVDSLFLAFKLSNYDSNKRLNRLNDSGAKAGLNLGSIKKFPLKIPYIKEQNKIASFLGAIALRITQLRRKHELLETYKKGVMQKIFSQQIRFKQDDGKPFPDWEYKKLRTISKPIKRQLESEETIVMSISSGSGFVDQKERFNQVIAGSSLKKYTLIKKYEFAYNRGASKAFPFGCIYMMEEKDEALIPFVYRTFRLTEGTPYFFAQYFLTGYLDRQLRKMISSSARMDGLLNIGEKDFFTIQVPFPVNEEQEKIANFLTSIDKKIEAVALQIEKLEEFKKGLLQKMFV